MSNQVMQAVSADRSYQYSESTDATILTEIFNTQTPLAIWKRRLSPSIQDAAAMLVENNPTCNASAVVTADTALESFKTSCPDLSEDIAELVGMFCMLLDVEQAGVRLSVLDNAMCPKFHVDRIPCRLITTYHGVATQWLPHESVDRNKLGHGSKGKADNESGLFKNASDIQQLNQGDVALLKGDIWDDNEGTGVVHRSPQVENNERRLLLTMDVVN